MVVVDEQHRFGVEQRDRLRAKAPDGLTPHLLVMTATPIPRTVALTVYGDLETSTLRELPRGRQPIATNTIFIKEKPLVAGAGVAAHHRGGRRRAGRPTSSPRASMRATRPTAKDAGPPATTVVELLEQLRHGPLSGLRLGLMHGRLPADEKDAVMAAFRAGEVDVLVCTTVIEVGVDVPNATVMFVMDADRFGISQLHQLRGRIGRGEHPSLCLLATQLPEGSKAGRTAARRWQARWTDSSSPTSISGAPRGRRVGLQPIRPAHHAAIPVAVRAPRHHRSRPRLLRGALPEKDPAHPGMAVLAAQFTDTDRVEYLDKA